MNMLLGLFTDFLTLFLVSTRSLVSYQLCKIASANPDHCSSAHHITDAEVDVVDEDDAVRAEAFSGDSRAAVAAALAPERLQGEVAHLGQKLYPVLARRPRQAPCTACSLSYCVL